MSKRSKSRKTKTNLDAERLTPSGLPADFLVRLATIVDDTWRESVLRSFEAAKKTSFRVNTLFTEPGEVLTELQELGVVPQALAWCANAFWVEPEARDLLTHSTAATEGRIYIQGLSSILATLILDPQPGEWNLDLAAAPGGKSSHMVCRMKNQGKLSVVEPIRKRMYRLADNLKRMGSEISKTYLMDGRKAGQKVPDRFDRVMLDAPCSSEARMRLADPDSCKYWSLRKIREQSRKQTGLIASAFQALQPGGTMLYCTCSFAPEENEAVVNALLSQSGERAELLEIEMPFSHWQPGLQSFADQNFEPAITHCRRILPNEHFDAFFMAKIRKAF